MGLSAKKVIIGIFTGFLSLLKQDKKQVSSRDLPDKLERPSAKESDAIPVLFGTADIKDACLAYFGGVHIDKINEANRTSNYKYYVGMHFILCDGNADKIIKVRVDEKDIYVTPFVGDDETDIVINVDKPDLFGGFDEDGGVVGKIRFQDGMPTQGRNTFLSEAIYDLPSTEAPIPAFRGVTGLIAEDVYIGTAPYVKKWDFRVQRIHKTFMGAEQWYDEKASIDNTTEKQVLEYDDYVYRYDYITSGWYGGWVLSQQPFGDGTPTGIPYPINTVLTNDPSFYIYKHVFDLDARNDFVISGACDTFCQIFLIPGDYIPDIEEGDLFGDYLPRSSRKIYDTDADGYTTGINFSKTISSSKYENGEHTLYCIVDSLPNDNYFYAAIDKLPMYSMNPVHIIREVLTSESFGRGFTDDDIDSTSFESAADTLYTEGVGISKVWDRSNVSIDEFIEDIKSHIDAKLFVDRITGKWTIKLIRDDYTKGELLTITDSNCHSISNFKKTAYGDLINSVHVVYSNLSGNTNGSVIAKDESLIYSQGSTVPEKIEYKGFTNADIATLAARRELLILSTQLRTLTVNAFRQFESLRLGDAVIVDSDKFKIDDTVFRVNKISYPGPKDRQVKIDLIEDIFTLPAPTITIQDDDEWKDADSNPDSVLNYFNEEIPYYLLNQIKGDDVVDAILTRHENAGFLCAAAAWPDNGVSTSADMWVSNTGGAYEYQTKIDFCPYAVLGADITETASSFTFSDEYRTTYVNDDELFSVGSEIMQVVSYNYETGAISVKRGMLDTVAQTHSADDYAIFWHNYLSTVGTEYSFTVSLDSKFLSRSSSSAQQLTDVSASNVWMDSRAYKPYLPGNLKVNGEYFPESIEGTLVLTWAHRNRGSSTLQGFTDSSVTSESGVTYTLRIYDEDDTLVLTETGITAETYTYSTESGVNNSLRFELESVRDGYSSFYMYNHTVNRAGYNLQYNKYYNQGV